MKSFPHLWKLLVLNVFRFDGCNFGITFEVLGVKCQKIFNFVRLHRGDDLCVVNLNAGNGMIDDNLAPVFINFYCVGQKYKKSFKSF